jgi:hypothetical protein
MSETSPCDDGDTRVRLVLDRTKRELFGTIPDSIRIVQKPYGRALESLRAFPKGVILYTAQYHTIPNDGATYTLRLRCATEPELAVEHVGVMHSVKSLDDTRQLYGFDEFMNHSCVPNTYFSASRQTAHESCFEYDAIVNRDIHAGDEITCNYLLFEYELDGRAFDCECGAENCFRSIRGFKNCTLHQKLSILPHVDPPLVDWFRADHPEILLRDLRYDDKRVVLFSTDRTNYGIKSTQAFDTGDVVFENTIEAIPLTHRVAVRCMDGYRLLSTDVHFTKHQTFLAYYGIDSFTNHSCKPNCTHAQLTPTTYQMRALCPIQVGDEITCDYGAFTSEHDDSPFECTCGHESCRGTIF